MERLKSQCATKEGAAALFRGHLTVNELLVTGAGAGASAGAVRQSGDSIDSGADKGRAKVEGGRQGEGEGEGEGGSCVRRGGHVVIFDLAGFGWSHLTAFTRAPMATIFQVRYTLHVTRYTLHVARCTLHVTFKYIRRLRPVVPLVVLF